MRRLCDRRVAAIFAAAGLAFGTFAQVAPPPAVPRPAQPPVVIRPRRSQEAGPVAARLAG